MQKKLKLAVIALCYVPLAYAQTDETQSQKAAAMDESAFTFTEAQLGDNDDMSQNVTIIGSNNNMYADRVGFLFSPVRFRYRSLNQKYNDVHINGVLMNDMESGQFRYSLVGGLNRMTRNADNVLAFENGGYNMPNMAGGVNYDFRAASFAAGHRVSLGAANRNYTLRGVYTYSTGLMPSGWAVTANITYRWANRGYVEGTFYNALSYFLGVEKIFGNHSLSFATWGNPTERSTQGASTDEAYWMANSNFYNPYWGYQDGKKRNSRVVNDYAPAAILTWDWKITDDMKLTTSVFGKYSMYKSTKLNYNNTDNPQPDYWKVMPSSYYDVFDESNEANRTLQALGNWTTAYSMFSGSKANRQINFDQLIYSNKMAAENGQDAMYFIQAKHNDALTLSLSSAMNMTVTDKSKLNFGIMLGTNKGSHYQTMEDMLGAKSFHNINTYALGTYTMDDDRVQYDLNNRNGAVGEGDKFGFDYDILVSKGFFWANYSADMGRWHANVAARTGGVQMQRDGKMRNGMAPEFSYGKSGKAHFGELGGKGSLTYDAGHGHVIALGAGYEWRAPQASTAFAAPEISNDFVDGLKNERIFSSELSYQFHNSWLHMNLNGYYSRLNHVTEWQNFYFDDINSFSYVSLTGLRKAYYGVELAARIKMNSMLDLKLLGSMGEGKNTNNAQVRYMNSTKATYARETAYVKDMREAGTPLTALSAGLSFHNRGWFVDLNCNYYDRIYLSYSPSYRYASTLAYRQQVEHNVFDNEGNLREEAVAQTKGHGGFMVDGSVGRYIRLKGGRSLSINLMLTNILNNTRIATGGYEQSRSDYTGATSDNVRKRVYKFSRNPKKYYALGANGMLNVTYKF